MRNLHRNINIGFRVNEEEQALMHRRMEEVGIHNLRAYLLRMALHGYIIHIDLKDVRECSRLLRIVSNNVNQIAKRVNAGGSLYADDIADVRERLDGIWANQNKIIRDLSNILEAA